MGITPALASNGASRIDVPHWPAAAGPEPAPAWATALRQAAGADAGAPATATAPHAAPAEAVGRRDGAIPTPPIPATFDVGPLHMHTYGLLLGAGGVTAGVIFSKVAARTGVSTAGMGKIMLPTIAAGLVGARLYHVATKWDQYKNNPGDIAKVWDGGLGIYGGLAAGSLVGSVLARRAGLPVAGLLDVAAVALPFAQSIGRWGNYENQELYGKPTNLPWGMQIDPAHREGRFADRNSYHPTFLYESLYDAGLGVGLLALSKTWKGRPPGVLFATYIAGYAAGRFGVESLRIDPSASWHGMRTNQWVSAGIFAAAGATALGLVARAHLKP